MEICEIILSIFYVLEKNSNCKIKTTKCQIWLFEISHALSYTSAGDSVQIYVLEINLVVALSPMDWIGRQTWVCLQVRDVC